MYSLYFVTLRGKRMVAAALAVGMLSWGAVAAFAAPIVPGGTEPYAWYRADVGVSTVGGGDDTVTAWADQSVNNRHLNETEDGKTIGGAPQATNNGALGQQVITFDGNDYLSAQSDTDWGFAGNGWVFAVWQRTGAEGALDGAQGGGGRQRLDTRDNEPPIGAAIGAFACCGPIQSAFIPDTVGQNAWAYTAVDYWGGAGGQERIRINGTGITIPGALDSQGMDGVVVGDYKNLNGGWNGDIAELINAYLSDR